MNHTFQINLRGIIDLLSDHLYSSPEVFLRELLQNGVDAIRARQRLEPEHHGRVTISVVEADDGRVELVFEDNGIGLTEEETHCFLATIGASSKREEFAEQRNDFIGQFGIGLLSCFMVSDEIVMVTRSAKEPGCVVEWRGRADGTYDTRRLDPDAQPFGTQVYLSCREGRERLFQADEVARLARHYGSMLPFPIEVCAGQ
ncbi:MAG: ATP-binding protein, partial [Myxococcota bacterium]